jgi:hypothetical protein
MLQNVRYGLVLIGVTLLLVTPLSALAHHTRFSVHVGVSTGPFIYHQHHGFIHHRHHPFVHGHVFMPFPPLVVVEPPPPPVVYVPPPPPRVVYAPAPPVATATLQILVAPLQAEIYLDGRYIGRAEDFRDGRVQLSVSPGSHTVELRFGTASRTHTITIEPGSTALVSDRLS